MIIKTRELTGAALDWAVAKCGGMEEFWLQADEFRPQYEAGEYHYSTDWSKAGPIIEREEIEWQFLASSGSEHRYGARRPSLGGLNRTFCVDGPNILTAAMRCYVASKLGDEVEIPNEVTA